LNWPGRQPGAVRPRSEFLREIPRKNNAQTLANFQNLNLRRAANRRSALRLGGKLLREIERKNNPQALANFPNLNFAQGGKRVQCA